MTNWTGAIPLTAVVTMSARSLTYREARSNRLTLLAVRLNSNYPFLKVNKDRSKRLLESLLVISKLFRVVHLCCLELSNLLLRKARLT